MTIVLSKLVVQRTVQLFAWCCASADQTDLEMVSVLLVVFGVQLALNIISTVGAQKINDIVSQ